MCYMYIIYMYLLAKYTSRRSVLHAQSSLLPLVFPGRWGITTVRNRMGRSCTLNFRANESGCKLKYQVWWWQLPATLTVYNHMVFSTQDLPTCLSSSSLRNRDRFSGEERRCVSSSRSSLACILRVTENPTWHATPVALQLVQYAR